MELAILIISIDKTVGSNTVQKSKEFNTSQAKKEEQLVSMMLAIKIVWSHRWWYSSVIYRKGFSEKYNRLLRWKMVRKS